MQVVQVNFGRSAMDIARADIHDALERLSKEIMTGRLEEADYKFKAGIAYGLQQALKTLGEAETVAQKEM